jgi:nicotinamidase-related amidase
MVQSFRSILGMPPSTASPSDSALVIIDAQNEYSSGALKVTNAAASGKVIANLLEKYRSANGKIIHVLHKTPDGAPIFTPGTELADEFKELTAKVRLSLCDRSPLGANIGVGRRNYHLEAVPWVL